MQGAKIRTSFLEYFKKHGHSIVPSSSLVRDNDPTLLFTNAGMNQFKDCFLGADKRSYSRAVSCQKCLRISGKHNDFENVGLTARHHTFFEMLGNFSFGDYFKAEAIKFAWEYVTSILGIPESKLWVTVFEKDDEAAKLWRDQSTIKPERILRMGEKDNFWAMGETGPCGPCSEIYYFVGEDDSLQTEKVFRRDDGLFVEIWNLVFMQYDRDQTGALTPLPKPSVDTGMGLERTAMVMQKTKSNYDTDLLRDVIAVCEQLSGIKYDGSSYALRDLRVDMAYARDVAMRVIADHSRAISFIIADGVQPSNEGKGYVLRRFIRRAVRHARVLQFKEPFLKHTTEKVVAMMGEHYHELRERKDFILKVVEAEERKFHETLEAGMLILQKEIEKTSKSKLFSGSTAFLLHDTYGFPLDLTEDALKAYQLKVDVEQFNTEMLKQKTRSREDRKAQGLVFNTIKFDSDKTKFVGYETLEAESKLRQIISDDSKAIDFAAGAEVSLVFDATPFYAEAGGQVGDSGTVTIRDVSLRVLDTQKVQDAYYVHRCVVEHGRFSPKLLNESAILKVDAARRARIRANHSATHLLHSALREVLGSHVKQAGSRVDEDSFRFDYSHFEVVTQDQLMQIQMIANEQIRANHEVVTKILPIEQAKKTGATALFGEKYGDTVRVVEIGAKSLEFCGGTHVKRSGDIGFLMVANEGGISAGVRRIECWGGLGAERELYKERNEISLMADILKSDRTNLPDRLEKLLAKNKGMEREIESLKAKLAGSNSSDLLSSARVSPKGIRVIAERVDGADTQTLRSMVDTLKVKLGSGVVALGSAQSVEQGGKALIIAGVTDDLIKTVDAGALLREVTKFSGGKGGGKANFAQAGGVDPNKLHATLDKLFEMIG